MSKKFISKYQCVVFGNFDAISASPDVVKFMIENFMDKQLIPTQYQEQSIALSKDEVKHETKARIALKSFDQKFEIKFLPDRCDFTHNDFITDDSFSMEMFAKRVKEYLTIIASRFTGLYNRIGVVVETFHENIELSKTVKNFNTLPEHLSDGNCVEWFNKIAVRKKIAHIDEPFNHSVENFHLEGEIIIGQKRKLFKGIRSTVDINTLAQDVSNRFDIQKVSDYLDLIIPEHKILQEQNSALIN